MTIGLAGPFARPARSAVTVAVVLLGATAVTTAAGIEPSLIRIEDGTRLVNTVQAIAASPPRGNPHAARADQQAQAPFPGGTQQVVEAAIREDPGTLHYVAEAHAWVSVAGLGQVPVTAFRGDASWIGYQMVSGHWYTGPDQVDVPLGFLEGVGKKIGDTITISYAGRQVRARIAGDVFDPDNSGIVILTGWQTLAGADPGLASYSGNGVPATFLAVYEGWEIAGLALAGLLIAVAGALLPAGWATRVSAAAALRAE